MRIKKIIAYIVVVVVLIVILSIGSVSFLFFEFSKAQARENTIRKNTEALADVSSVLSEFLFSPTARNKRQLRLAVWRLGAGIDRLDFFVDLTPRVHLLHDRQEALVSNVNWLLECDAAMYNGETVNERTEMARMEVGGQSLLTIREIAGYLSEIDARVRRDTIVKQMTMLGSSFAAICIISAAIGMILLWMQQRLLVPVFRLRYVARRITEGDYAVETGVNRTDEIGDLASSFDTMKNAIRAHVTALAESEENLRATLNSIGDAVIATDIAGHITGMNPVAEKLTGWSREEALGHPVDEIFRIINAHTRALAPNPVSKVLETGAIVGLANHTALVGRDGVERQIADSGAPIRGRDGGLMGVVLVFRVVTESYRIQESLRESEERYRSFVERFKGIAYRGRMDFSVEFFHGAVAEITGYTEQEFVTGGIRWDALIHPDDIGHLFTEDEARLHSIPGYSYERSYRICRKDGRIRWVQDNIQNVCDDTGKPVFLQGTIYDITDRKNAEASLVRARDELEKYAAELEATNRDLEDFVYIASHDLKEPLRGIHNYSSFLLEDYADRLDADGQAKLHTLMRLTRRLESLLDDLLHYSRVGRIELVMRQTDPARLVREVLETMENTLEENLVTVSIAEDMPPVVCDRASVGEVFRNLISNAVKYNDNNHKQVEIGWIEGDAGSVVLYVRDNGIGIPDKHQEKVFTIFKRLHGRDQYGGGTGAGLTLVRRIIERHGGSIRVTSEYGAGSTFWFTLPGGKKND